MHDERMNELLTGLREEYNAPPETPREEMWSVIQARLGAGDRGAAEGLDVGPGRPGGRVLSLEEARRARSPWVRRPLGWAAAAAAVLALGVGIGRMTAPGAGPAPEVASGVVQDPGVLRAAAVQHLARTESLLTLLRADARIGGVAPSAVSWARGLLSQTRLLLDAQGDADPALSALLGDLELVLIQIVGAANAAEDDPARVRWEMNLALEGMEEREVLPRIQAVVPAGPRFVGT